MAFDREFLGESVRSEPAENALAAVSTRCIGHDGAELETCVLQVVFEDLRFEAAPDHASVAESSVAHVIGTGRGTCAALVAVLLAVGDPLGQPFDAVVFRDHVVLASSTAGKRFYETLAQGRSLSERELDRFRTGPIAERRVDAYGYAPYYLDNIAARLVRDGDFTAAAKAFERALDLAPDAGRIRYNFGSFLLRQERYGEALEELDRAIALGWADADTLANRGVALWKLGRIAEARRAFRAALGLDPRHPAAAANLAVLDP